MTYENKFSFCKILKASIPLESWREAQFCKASLPAEFVSQ